MAFLLPIVSGIFIGTSYIPFPPWASVFAFVPLWIFLRRSSSLRNVLIGSWITQFTLTLIGFNWVAFTVHEFGHMPWIVAVIVLLFFCSVANLDVPLAAAVWFLASRKLRLSPSTGLIFLALITALFEAWIPTLFPWNYGYTLYWAGLPAFHLAELIGFQGLSALVILTNILTFKIWERWAEKKRDYKLAMKGLALAGWLIFLNGAGWALKSSLPEPDASAKFLITQANIGNLEKQFAEHGYGYRDPIVRAYSELTESALKEGAVDFVVWPETAFPYEIDLRRSTFGEQLLGEKVEQWQTTLITGGYGYGTSADEPDKVSNTFFIFEPSGRLYREPYIKTHLLAFGEYVPGATYFPQLKRWIPAGDFARGKGAEVKTAGNLIVGPQICYESLFPDFSREMADLGAEVYVNLTNDSWYGEWQEPFQHLYMTLGRAVEYRRPLIRATNTGISTVALADGTVLERSPMGKKWTGRFEVPYKTRPAATFYQNYPWLVNAVLFIFTMLIIGRAYFDRTAKPGLAGIQK